MAFAQLTYRESLRDIETCLSVHASKLYHMGFRQPVRRSTASPWTGAKPLYALERVLSGCAATAMIVSGE